MDIFNIACGNQKTGPGMPRDDTGRSPEAKQMLSRVMNEGFRKFDWHEVDPWMELKRALDCIEMLLANGYTVVTEPLIPDFGNTYKGNMKHWLSSPNIRKASNGTLSLLNNMRIFENAYSAKRYHAKKLAAWTDDASNACAAPPVIRYRTDGYLWRKVRHHVRNGWLPALFWQEDAAKREMNAKFDEQGRGQLIGRGAKREREEAMSMPMFA